MREVFEGNAWVFDDQVSTDQILPGRYLDRPMEEVGRYAMAGLDETFPQRVQPGDLVVGGTNFGSGSSREAAVLALKQAGIAAVIAQSFARIFFRNAINNGFPAAMVADTSRIATGDRLRLDFDTRTLTNDRSGEVQPMLSLTGTSQDILAAGGIVNYTLARLERSR